MAKEINAWIDRVEMMESIIDNNVYENRKTEIAFEEEVRIHQKNNTILLTYTAARLLGKTLLEQIQNNNLKVEND